MKESMKEGDIVWLKCGGLPMIITVKLNSCSDIAFVCVWHDLEGKPQRENYTIDCLTLENPLN